MKFALTLETNLGGKRNDWINNLSEGLERHFATKNYGDDLKELLIGIIVVAPEFDFFFKERKPKYRQGKREVSKHGTRYEVEDSVTYDLKLDFSNYSNFKEDEFLLKLKNEIFSSIHVLQKIKKLKKFDFESFQSDLKDYLKIDEKRLPTQEKANPGREVG